MPEAWSAAITAVKEGLTSTMGMVTADTLLLALTFGFLFVRKGIGLVKRLIRLGGKN